MKTAVSIPDDIFRRAERLARRTKRSRSRLVAEALDEYLARHGTDEVTQAMNETVRAVGEPAEAFVTAAARETLRRSEW